MLAALANLFCIQKGSSVSLLDPPTMSHNINTQHYVEYCIKNNIKRHSCIWKVSNDCTSPCIQLYQIILRPNMVLSAWWSQVYCAGISIQDISHVSNPDTCDEVQSHNFDMLWLVQDCWIISIIIFLITFIHCMPDYGMILKYCCAYYALLTFNTSLTETSSRSKSGGSIIHFQVNLKHTHGLCWFWNINFAVTVNSCDALK